MSSQLPNIKGVGYWCDSGGVRQKYFPAYYEGSLFESRPPAGHKLYHTQSVFMDVGNGGGVNWYLGSGITLNATRSSKIYKDDVTQAYGDSIAMNAFIKARTV